MDRHYSRPDVQGDVLRLVDTGEKISGKTLHASETVGFRPSTVKAGQKKIVTTNTAVAVGAGLAAGAGRLMNGVVITAKPANAGKIFVGPAGVTTTDDGAGNGYALEAGQSISFLVDDLAHIVINGTAGDSVYYAGN